MRAPRRITDLDPALSASDDDFLSIVQTVDRGTPTERRRTFKISWSELMQRVIAVISDDRAAMAQAFKDQLAVINAQNANIQTLIDQITARKAVVTLPDVSIPAASLISVTGGTLTFTRPCVGVRVGDSVTLTPKALAVGYGLRGFSIPANDQITITLWCPILTVGGTAQNFGVTAFR